MVSSILEKRKINRQDLGIAFPILLPVVIENIINCMFSIADTTMLGHSASPDVAIAAVGITGALNNFALGVPTNFFIGLTVIIAQAWGRGDKEDCKKYTAKFFPLALFIGLIASVFFYSMADHLVTWLGTNDEIKAEAINYFRTLSIGYFFHVFVVYVSAALRGVGITKITMVYNLGAGAINVFLNWCLINGHLGCPALGVTGAALATTLSRVITFVIVIGILFFAKTPICMRGVPILPKKNQVSLQLAYKTGCTTASEQIILQAGAIVTTAILTIIPTGDYSAYTISTSIESLIWALAGAITATTTTLAGQAFGMRDMARLKAHCRMMWYIGMCMGAVLAITFSLFGRQLASIYTKDTSHFDLVQNLLYVHGILSFGVLSHSVFASTMRGIGKPKSPLIAAMISLWVCRVCGDFICIRILGMGVMAVVCCLAADQFVRAIVNFVLYRREVHRIARQEALVSTTSSQD